MPTAITRSVRYKVLAVVLATTLVALLVSAVALLTYEAQNYREFLISDATTQADILARTSAPALQFEDPTAAAENLALLASRRGIVAAAIYTPTGEVFARYLRNPEVTLPALESPARTSFSAGDLEVFHPIIANDQLIGSVYVRATNDLAGRLQDYVLILGLVMLLSLAVAGVISAYLQRSVTAPVLAVTKVARRVMTERDFSLRAEKTTEDEVGVLVDSFNAMLAEVGQMTQTLESTNQRLLEETEERRSAEAALRLADQRKDEFLATLAHELRNPLAPMVNALWIMEASGPGGDTRQARDIIRRQLSHMVRLIDDLLDVSRITRGKLSIQMNVIELGSVIQNAIDTVKPFIDTQQHTLKVDVPKEPVHLKGDSVRLSQVFSNLLDNAAKYTAPGGRIALRARTDGTGLEVTISDNGIGMSSETLEHAFDMFVQGTDTQAGWTHAGLGVGLGLARRLVALHGGTIEADSGGPGRGSTFTVRLDAVPAPPGAPGGAIGDGEADGAVRRRILLVDDNADFVDSLAVLLRGLGHDVTVAYDGPSALDVARELEPDVALLDLGLPRLNGYELALELRQLPGGANMVLIALSGWGQDKDRQRSREHGFAAHLVKPVDVEKVRSALEDLVSTP
jgi:signal transduction histidine kinase